MSFRAESEREMSNNWLQDATEPIRNSKLLRVLLIGFLVLLLQIPIEMISGVIGEREGTRDNAVRDVISSWGGDQTIAGPWVSVPYLHHWTEQRTTGSRVDSLSRTETRHATFLPETLRITGTTASEVRYRGIFQVPLYTVSLEVSGDFIRPDFSAWGTGAEDILWEQAYLSLGVSDSKGITDRAVLNWNGDEFGFLPGPGGASGAGPGIHVPLAQSLEGEAFDFSFPLELNGSEGVYFTPFGRETEVELTSDWSDPSFEGNWLPKERSVSSEGF